MNDETVEVADESRVARLDARDRQVGRRAPVVAPELAHLRAAQPPQTAPPASARDELLQPFPTRLALLDKRIRHYANSPQQQF
jgi:hypothetical protein